MGVKSYVGKNGEMLWTAFAYSRSQALPGLKIEKERSGLATEREAQTILKQIQRECEREILLREAQGSTWGAVVEEWIKTINVSDRLSASTRIDYASAATNYTTNWWRRSAASISPADVRELLEGMKTQGRSHGFVKRIKHMLDRIFVFGMERRLIRGLDRSPAHGVPIGREEEKEPEILTTSEIRKLLSTSRELNHEWYYHWAMALLTGMRNGELYALQWSDVDWERSSITVSRSYNSRFNVIKSTKAGYWRTVPISSELRSLLLELRAQSGTRPHLLPRPREWQRGMQAEELRKFCLGIGLPSVRFHTLRACFATQLIRNGVPPIQIQKICGWKDLKTMQRYIRLAGIEVDGATESLNLLPEAQIAAKVVNMFTREGSDQGTNG